MTHRPKIIVREFQIDALTDDFNGVAGGSFRVTNKGATKAFITLIEATWFVGKALPPDNPCFGKTLTGAGHMFVAGGTTRFDMPLLSMTPDQVAQFMSGHLGLFAIGKIVYTDEIGNGRHTGFARSYDQTS